MTAIDFRAGWRQGWRHHGVMVTAAGYRHLNALATEYGIGSIASRPVNPTPTCTAPACTGCSACTRLAAIRSNRLAFNSDDYPGRAGGVTEW